MTTPSTSEIPAPSQRQFTLSNSHALGTGLALCLAIDVVFAIVLAAFGGWRAGAVKGLIMAVPILAVILAFPLVMGWWTLNDDGISCKRPCRSIRQLAWDEIDRVVWTKDWTKLRGRNVKISIAWSSLDRKSPEAFAFIQSKLGGWFDLNLPPPAPGGSIRRTVLASAVAVSILLILSLRYLRDPVRHTRSGAFVGLVGIAIAPATALLMLFMIWRNRHFHRRYFGWRTRIAR